MSYIRLLSEQGDPIERRGTNECGLGEIFPRYAEFWATNVFPYRDPADYSKLIPGFPKELETICNNHYSVFYHLTYAKVQINFLQFVPSAAEVLLDIGNPLYHLVTAADLVERTFLATFRANKQLTITKLTQQEIDALVEGVVNNYDKRLSKFQQTYKPVSLNFHSISPLFQKLLKDHPALPAYKIASDHVRQYRNIFTHSLSPLRLILDGEIHLPKREFLDEYDEGYWSSERQNANPEKYAPALEIIAELGDKLVLSANELWEFLIREMSNAINTHMPSNLLGNNQAEVYKNLYHPPGVQNHPPYFGGTPNYPMPPLNPSGYKPESENDPF